MAIIKITVTSDSETNWRVWVDEQQKKMYFHIGTWISQASCKTAVTPVL